jgi:hypothetical protein
VAGTAAAERTDPGVDDELARTRRALRRDHAALEGLVRALKVLREGVRALEAENRQLRAQLWESEGEGRGAHRHGS